MNCSANYTKDQLTILDGVDAGAPLNDSLCGYENVIVLSLYWYYQYGRELNI